MAGVARVKHHTKAYRELLTDPKVQADLKRRAARIADAAGGKSKGFVAESSTPRKRARAAVIATRGDSNNAMIRSLDAGR